LLAGHLEEDRAEEVHARKFFEPGAWIEVRSSVDQPGEHGVGAPEVGACASAASPLRSRGPIRCECTAHSAAALHLGIMASDGRFRHPWPSWPA
jgi:hypothetical protein